MTNHLDNLLALWTTKEIADRMGVTSAEVSRWRGGYRRPKPVRIREIGDALAALRCAPNDPSDEAIAIARREVALAVTADAASRRLAHRS